MLLGCEGRRLALLSVVLAFSLPAAAQRKATRTFKVGPRDLRRKRLGRGLPSIS
jgi:hypothetical protein